jgi:hypothetical protein
MLPVDESNPHLQEIAGNAKLLAIDGVWSRYAAADKVRQVMKSLN